MYTQHLPHMVSGSQTVQCVAVHIWQYSHGVTITDDLLMALYCGSDNTRPLLGCEYCVHLHAGVQD